RSPEVKLTDDFGIPPKKYQIKIHGTVVAEHEMRVGELMVLLGNRKIPDIPGEEVREPAFGMRAYSVMETFAEDLKREQYTYADNMSVLLTHLSEVIRNNLPQLLSRSEEHTSELQSRENLVCRLLLEKKKTNA